MQTRVPEGVRLCPPVPVVSTVLGLEDLLPCLVGVDLGDQPCFRQYPLGLSVPLGLLENPPLLAICVPFGLREPSLGRQYRRVPFGVRLGRPPWPRVCEYRRPRD